MKIKFIKNTQLRKIGDITEASKKSAESYVGEGYAVYVKDPKDKIRKKLKKEVKEKVIRKELKKEVKDKVVQKETESPKELSAVELLKIFGLGKLDNYWEYLKKKPIHIKKPLTDDIIQQHIDGKKILGSSPFIDNEHVNTGTIDFDVHTKGMTEEQIKKAEEQVEEDFQKINKFLIKQKACFFGTISGGGTGKHINVYQPNTLAKDMRAFLLRMQAGLLAHTNHEVFPKQNDLNENRPYGNQVKVFLGIHPKTKKRTDVILDNKVLSFEDSVKHLNSLLDNYNTFKKFTVSEEDYKNLEKEYNIDLNALHDVPNICPFIERIASKKLLTSGGTTKDGANMTRHQCLDPNIAAYVHGREDRKQLRTEYKQIQDRNDSALDNWKKYWVEGKPSFNCGQIIAYLLDRKHNNDEAAKEGLDICRKCPRFKEHHKRLVFKDISNISNVDELLKIEQIKKIVKKIKFINDNMLIELYIKKIVDKTGFPIKTIKDELSGDKKKIKIRKTDFGFIFYDEEVVKSKIFVQDKTDENIFHYGIHLPKNITYRMADGRTITKQEWLPVLINSEKKLIEVDNEKFEREQKITFPDIPTNLSLRYSLELINKFVSGEDFQINGLSLFKKIRALYEKYCAFPEEEWYDIHALWDIGTYFFMLFSNYPINELRGIKGSGKTKVMTISSFISFNGTPVMIDPSESTLFRETNDNRPTKYIDEAEKLFAYNKITNKFEGDCRAELLNGSYQKGSCVPRQEKVGNKFITKWFYCYSPTMIGSIQGLYGATESRALTHITTKNSKTDKRGNTEPTDDENQKIWQEIRNDLFVFGLLNWKKIEEDYLKMKNSNIKNIEARNLQLWKPLLTIAKTIDKTLYETVEKFAIKLSTQQVNDLISEGSVEDSILTIVYQMLKKNDKIYTNDIRLQFNRDCEKEYDKLSKKSKTISSKLDMLGFKQYRDFDSNKGSFFKITHKIFRRLIEPVKPTLFSEDLEDVENPEKINIDNIEKHDNIDETTGGS